MNQKIITISNRNVINDCPTRWNSTFIMVQRLLEMRPSSEKVLGKNKIDRNSEWNKLQEMVNLLKPFAQQRDFTKCYILELVTQTIAI